ncbi:MAG: HU family DNA-binding protein [Candidatus Azobacteroides sp.]|nr:HU family DNA-binding protein [Candidatus Azobacteroides sp.]
MSLKYSVAALENPQKREEPVKYYMRSQTRETVSLERLVEDVSWGTTLTHGDVTHVITTLIERITQHMKDGDCVELPRFGRFRYVISSHGAISREACNENYLRRVRVQFKPAVALEADLRKISFEKVLPVNVRKEAAKNL